MISNNHRVLFLKKGHTRKIVPQHEQVEAWMVPQELWEDPSVQFFTYVDVVLSEKKWFKATISVCHRSMVRMGNSWTGVRGNYQRVNNVPVPRTLLHGRIEIRADQDYSISLHSSRYQIIDPLLGRIAYDMFLEARERYLELFQNHGHNTDNS